ncbi:MAG: hypothetical protein EBV64_14660 [Oxalobacteraceae bacterium]|nr:hypothetical protein [Oxalobacteraceae bacterium]
MSDSREDKNRKLTLRLLGFAAGAFAFGFALVPLYDVLCDITGVGNPKDLLRASTVQAVEHDESRLVTVEFVADLPAGNALMSPSYSLASMLSYHGRTHVSVFGTGSYHGRFDDSLTDFSSYDGKSIRIVSTRRLDPSELEPFFSAVRVKQHILNDATFWIADGDGFRFARYW